MSKMSFRTSTMSSLLAWMDENNASAEEGAVHFLTSNKDLWKEWLNDRARENLSAILEQ